MFSTALFTEIGSWSMGHSLSILVCFNKLLLASDNLTWKAVRLDPYLILLHTGQIPHGQVL